MAKNSRKKNKKSSGVNGTGRTHKGGAGGGSRLQKTTIETLKILGVALAGGLVAAPALGNLSLLAGAAATAYGVHSNNTLLQVAGVATMVGQNPPQALSGVDDDAMGDLAGFNFREMFAKAQQRVKAAWGGYNIKNKLMPFGGSKTPALTAGTGGLANFELVESPYDVSGLNGVSLGNMYSSDETFLKAMNGLGNTGSSTSSLPPTW